MTKLPWPSDAIRSEFLERTIETIGREVDFVYVSGQTACPVCDLDPITNTSTDSFCPTCSGEYWIDLFGETIISGHVTWKYADKLGWETGGQQFEGDCMVKVPFSVFVEEIKDDIVSIIVDGKDMQVSKVDLRGSPAINRILFWLKEREKDG